MKVESLRAYIRADSVDLYTMMVVHPLAQIGAGRLFGRYRVSDQAPQLVRTSAIVCAGICRFSERTLTVLWPLQYR